MGLKNHPRAPNEARSSATPAMCAGASATELRSTSVARSQPGWDHLRMELVTRDPPSARADGVEPETRMPKPSTPGVDVSYGATQPDHSWTIGTSTKSRIERTSR